jgi:hypothetical protein
MVKQSKMLLHMDFDVTEAVCRSNAVSLQLWLNIAICVSILALLLEDHIIFHMFICPSI